MILATLDSAKTALLVIDKQISYTDDSQPLFKILGSKAEEFKTIIPRVDACIKRCRSKGIEIVWTKMIEDVNTSPSNIKSKMIANGTPSLSSSDEDSFEINGLQPGENEKVITKLYYDAFAQTDLDSHLKSKSIENVVLVGGLTSRCVLATAFGANGLDYNVIVPKELTGNPDKMAFELPAALEIIDSALGYVVSENDLNAFLK